VDQLVPQGALRIKDEEIKMTLAGNAEGIRALRKAHWSPALQLTEQ
jgi:hypothetical protein